MRMLQYNVFVSLHVAVCWALGATACYSNHWVNLVCSCCWHLRHHCASKRFSVWTSMSVSIDLTLALVLLLLHQSPPSLKETRRKSRKEKELQSQTSAHLPKWPHSRWLVTHTAWPIRSQLSTLLRVMLMSSASCSSTTRNWSHNLAHLTIGWTRLSCSEGRPATRTGRLMRDLSENSKWESSV